MGSVIPFDFDSNAVRVVMQNDAPWFVAKDVCDVLEIGKHRDAVARLDEDERGSVVVDTLGGNQKVSAVSESGLYSLIFRSRKPEAKKFRKWVTGEVLPSLRKHGRYGGQPLSLAQEASLHLKANVRSQALHCAVQVAKMQDGDEGEVDRLYEKYCAKFAAKPGLVRKERRLEMNAEGFSLWADTHLVAEAGEKEKHQASVLYDRYRHWQRKQDSTVAPMSMKSWGRLMKERYDFVKSGVYWYFVRHLEDECS